MRITLFLMAAGALALQAAAADSKPLDADTETKSAAPTVEFRANQINRCADASGRVKLQDTPCLPTPTSPAAVGAAASASDVVDLSALPPRSIDKEAAPSRRDTGSANLGSLALSLAWKVALFLAVAYAVFRMIRTWRDSYALKAAMAEPPRRTR